MNDAPRSKPRAAVAAGLHIVATPIGNMADLSLRARDTLEGVDFIACEDKRHTAKLLSHHGIHTATTAYHEHNAEHVRPALLQRLAMGQRVALVSDAGTPLLSDPGYKLVRDAVAAGISVSGVPGPNAAVLALVLSGLPTDRFLFLGFLPPKTQARQTALAEVRDVRASLILHESPRRLAACLRDAHTVLGPREAAVARELTKRHEELRRGSLDDLATHYETAGAPRGEVTVVIGPATEEAGDIDPAELDTRLDALLDDMSVRDASAQLAGETGLPRKAVYERALARRAARDGDGDTGGNNSGGSGGT